MNSAVRTLKGMSVLVPRGKDQSKPVSALIKEYGGLPVEIPLIAFRPTSIAKHIDSIDLEKFDWLIFTSSVTVDIFFSAKDASANLPRIAVIGKKTEKTLRKYGYHADFIPKVFVAESFVEEFAEQVAQGTNILLPKGNLAREYIKQGLAEHGADVEELVIYETFFPQESKKLLHEKIARKEIDILLFTSPSTINHFMHVVRDGHLEKQIKHCIIGCIGPVSKERAVEQGLTVHAMPDSYTVHDLLKSIITYINH
ncbi:uroporphyrinogen-III synthase [Cytobacillus horneckiae]|uniref:uroporphyrinogen-III synthase n=1 Tax=Cytobacillus horneckiae TaxID=549687 RepID=UPI00203BF57A|nr:uroporphyrinogen-III synthase [Cytobacillus horneckiae]